jgi:hypothetical protein
MWILKGVGTATALFLLFTFIYIRKSVAPLLKNLKEGASVGFDIRSLAADPPYWVLFILLIVAACFWFRLLEKITPVTLP